MPGPRYSLAIETASRAGSLSLGRNDTLLDTVSLPEQRRHNVGLMPGIDRLCREHRIGPAELTEVYVSLGPGSFTGLRVAIAAAKMLALTRGVRLVGVPTLDVVAQNTPPEHVHAAVCLSLKRGTMYCAVYRREREADMMTPVIEPGLRTMDELLRIAPRPVALLGEMLPELPNDMDERVSVLSPECAAPRSESVWRLGRMRESTDPLALNPLYVRPPEAVELWQRRHGSAERQPHNV